MRIIFIALLCNLLFVGSLWAEQFTVDLSMYEGKDPVKIEYIETLEDGREFISTVKIYEEQVNGRDCIVTQTESEVISVESCIDLKSGEPRYTNIVEKEYENAECLITYRDETVKVEYKEDGEVRVDSFENDRILDGYILTLLFSALPNGKLDKEYSSFRFLNYRKPSLINVNLDSGKKDTYKMKDTRVKVRHYKTSVDSFFLSMFSKTNHFYYGTKDVNPVMIRYEGADPSNIRKRLKYEITQESYEKVSNIFN